MLVPSQNVRGFVVDDDSCSILFGKGFGPRPYQELFDKWAIEFSSLEFTTEEMNLGQILQKRMHQCSSRNCYEGCLSGVVSALFQKLMTVFAEADPALKYLEVVHQTFVPQKTTTSSADIVVMDCCSSDERVTIHSIMEVNWEYDDSQFPE